MEKWKPAPGFPKYEVSSLGRIRSVLTRTPGKIIVTSPGSTGYLKFSAFDGAHKATINVHRLVALAFVDGDTSLQVNHKNGNRADCRAENLEWVTCSENHRHAYRTLKKPPNRNATGKPAHNRRPIQIIGADGTAFTFPHAGKFAKLIGRTVDAVTYAARHLKRCKGYEVRYV